MEPLNLLTIPLEIRSYIFENLPITPSDVKEISLVCHQLREEIRNFLTELPGDRMVVTSDFLDLFPRLKSTTLTVEVRTPQQLQDLSHHPSLHSCQIDVKPIYRYLQDPKIRSPPLTIQRRGKKQEFTINDLTDVVIFFLAEYRARHQGLKGTTFTFILPHAKFTVSPGSITNLPLKGRVSHHHWVEEAVIDAIQQLSPIYKYVGPWYPPNVPTLEEMTILLNFDSPLVDISQEAGQGRLRPEPIARFLPSFPKLRHLGFHLLKKKGYLPIAFRDFPLIMELADREVVVPSLEVLDYPLLIEELPLVKKIFPNLQEPLLDDLPILTPDRIKILQTTFSKYRLLPNGGYH